MLHQVRSSLELVKAHFTGELQVLNELQKSSVHALTHVFLIFMSQQVVPLSEVCMAFITIEIVLITVYSILMYPQRSFRFKFIITNFTEDRQCCSVLALMVIVKIFLVTEFLVTVIAAER